jgi:hypothetical protein
MLTFEIAQLLMRILSQMRLEFKLEFKKSNKREFDQSDDGYTLLVAELRGARSFSPRRGIFEGLSGKRKM